MVGLGEGLDHTAVLADFTSLGTAAGRARAAGYIMWVGRLCLAS